jgi:hypothetical protein
MCIIDICSFYPNNCLETAKTMFKTIHGVVLSKNPNFLILQSKGKCRVANYMEPSISMCDHDTWDNDEV